MAMRPEEDVLSHVLGAVAIAGEPQTPTCDPRVVACEQVIDEPRAIRPRLPRCGEQLLVGEVHVGHRVDYIDRIARALLAPEQ